MHFQSFFNGIAERRLLSFEALKPDDAILKSDKKVETPKQKKDPEKKDQKETEETKETPKSLLEKMEEKISKLKEDADTKTTHLRENVNTTDNNNAELEERAAHLREGDTAANFAKNLLPGGILINDAKATKLNAPQQNIESVAAVDVKASEKVKTTKDDAEYKAQVAPESPDATKSTTASGQHIT